MVDETFQGKTPDISFDDPAIAAMRRALRLALDAHALAEAGHPDLARDFGGIAMTTAKQALASAEAEVQPAQTE